MARMALFEWKKSISRAVIGRQPRRKEQAAGRLASVFETKVNGKRVRVVAMTAGEARSQLKKQFDLDTTAELMVVSRSR